jgi:hypothetical protein
MLAAFGAAAGLFAGLPPTLLSIPVFRRFGAPHSS